MWKKNSVKFFCNFVILRKNRERIFVLSEGKAYDKDIVVLVQRYTYTHKYTEICICKYIYIYIYTHDCTLFVLSQINDSILLITYFLKSCLFDLYMRVLDVILLYKESWDILTYMNMELSLKLSEKKIS